MTPVADILGWALLALLSALIAFVLYGFNIPNRWAHRHLPGPRPSWLVGNLRQLGAPGKSHLALQRWAKQYGPCFVFYLGRNPCIVLSDPNLIKFVGVRFKIFHDRPAPMALLGKKEDEEFQNRGVLLATGKSWCGVRAACEPLFKQRALESYTPTINQAVNGLAGRLAVVSPKGQSINMSEALAGMTFDIIGSTAFGVNFDTSGSGQHSEVVRAAQTVFRPPRDTNPWVSIMALLVPHLKMLWGWLALRLGSVRVRAIAEARMYVYGLSQQLLDNARRSTDGKQGAATVLKGPAAKPVGDGKQPQAAIEEKPAAVGGVPTIRLFANATAASNGRDAALRAGIDVAQQAQQALFSASQQRTASRQAASSAGGVQSQAFERAQTLYKDTVPAANSVIHTLRNTKDSATGGPLSDRDICSQAYTLLLAGYETTSTALGYMLFEVAKSPELQERLRQEVEGLGLSPGASISFDHLQQLPLLEATFFETLRMYPPVTPLVALVRQPHETTRVGKYAIPAESRVMMNVWALHHDSLHFPEPGQFRPERFLADSEENSQRHPYAYIPFGVGPRKCLGHRLAREEAVLAVARLLLQFDFSLDSQRHKGPLDLSSALTLSPRGGVWLKAAGRV